jgi:lysyl-tRNA synthetase class 2
MISNPFFNPELRDNLLKRATLIKKIKGFFESENFQEVETPIVVRYPGQEPYLNHFITTVESPQRKYKTYLNTSPELQMKKLLAFTGFKNIFEITKAFRNNEDFQNSPLHNPEFTILEWYRQGVTYEKLMDDLKKICSRVNLKREWEKISVQDAFQKYARINLDECILHKEKLFKIVQDRDFSVSSKTSWNDLFHLIFLNEVEPKLRKKKAIILYDYPITLAALSVKKVDNPLYAERFELYIDGIEIANAYTELTDPKEQLQRFKEDQKERKSLRKYVAPIDKDFIAALEYIQSPTAGIALGVDRLIMLALDKKSIHEVTSFSALNT